MTRQKSGSLRGPVRIDRRPSVWSGSLFSLAMYFCLGSYLPFLYVHFADLGLSGKQVGLLAMLPPMMALTVSPVVASIADRAHIRVWMAQGGFVCLGVTLAMFRFFQGFEALVVLMIALALFTAPFQSIADGLVARMALRNQLNYGAMRLWGSVGFAVSAAACGALWQKLGAGSMFLVSGLLFVLPVLLVGLLEEGVPVHAEERQPVSHLLRDSGLVLLLVAALLAGIGGSLSATFSGIYARSLGGGNLLVGAMFSISALAELPTMFYSNRLADRFTEPKVLVASYLIMAAAFVGYWLVSDPWLLLGLCAIKGLGYGAWLTVTIRSAIRRTADHWASTAQAMLTVCVMGVAPLVAGPLGGLVHDSISPAAVFVFAAGALGLAGLVVVSAVRSGKVS